MKNQELRLFGMAIVGMVCFTKYKIAKMDWTNAIKLAEAAKEATS